MSVVCMLLTQFFCKFFLLFVCHLATLLQFLCPLLTLLLIFVILLPSANSFCSSSSAQLTVRHKNTFFFCSSLETFLLSANSLAILLQFFCTDNSFASLWLLTDNIFAVPWPSANSFAGCFCNLLPSANYFCSSSSAQPRHKNAQK